MAVLTLTVLLGRSICADEASVPQPAQGIVVSEVLQRTIRNACADCHTGDQAEARLDLDRMLSSSMSSQLSDWRNVLRAVREGLMPPKDASELSLAERDDFVNELRELIVRVARLHAHDPGPTQVRRLTNAELDYCIEDLTGLRLELGTQFVGDSVGGSGFTNAASGQFMQEAMLERYLETARAVADHAVIGSGPLAFYRASGQTGMELSAIERIQDLYRHYGFRASAGEGAKPFGLDRFARAFEVAWRYRYREVLEAKNTELDQLATQADLNPKFARQIWRALHREDAAFPLSEVINSFNRLPDPTVTENAESIIEERCRDLFEEVQRWQERFAGEASDEEEASILTAANVSIPSSRAFLVRARRKRIEQDGNFTPDLNNPRLYSEDGTVRLRITVEPASEHRQPVPSVILSGATFQFRFLEKVNPDPVPLRAVLTPTSSAQLEFRVNRGGEQIDADAFVVAVGEAKTVEVTLPEHCNLGELRIDAKLDTLLGRDSVVRCVIEDVTETEPTSRRRQYSSLLRDVNSRKMELWEEGLSEFARTFPQISHREPAPSDRDPIPAPYDNTYNLPERNFFHTAVKYHRDDGFLTSYLMPASARRELDQAWADLLLSFDYHNVNLRFTAEKFGLSLPTERIDQLEWNWIDLLPPAPREFIRHYKSEYEKALALMRSAESGHLEDLCRFAKAAWRRPLTPKQRNSLLEFYRSCRTRDQLSHREAVRSTLTRILVSPDFLFRIEQTPSGFDDQALSDHELATRLSFSLWSSVPDETLLTLAETGSLQDDAVLEQQVTRMLASPKAGRLATEFFGQWLGFYQFDRFRGVDRERFPEFDEALRQSLYQEAIAFCEHLIRQDRPYHDLIHADYAIVDRLAAEHYGLVWNEADSRGRRKLSLDSDHPRGGVLGLAAVLITTSAPLRTSPVKRGDWILRRLLGTPVPPPPADAGSIPADDASGDGKTLRELLELHRDKVACRGCHVRIDPLGFALEHFDALGRWRTAYRDGEMIDDAGVLDSGDRIEGIAGLKRHLRSKDEAVRRTLASRLTAYMLGRPESIADAALIQDVTDRLATDSRFSSAVKTIVLSPQFRRIRGDGERSEAAGDGGTKGRPRRPAAESHGVKS
jgi:hypothetical protein